MFDDEGPDPVKVGWREDYPGESVFYSKDEAEKHCSKGYDVYGFDTTEENVKSNLTKSGII